MPSDEQLDKLASALADGSLDPKILPEDKRRNLKIALIDYQTRKTGRIVTPSLEVAGLQQVPGMFPQDEEKKIWDQGQAQGLPYGQIKANALKARNEYTQYRPEGGLGENIQGASAIVANTALAPLGLAKKGIESVGQGIQDKFPDSMTAKVAGGAVKFGANAIPSTPLQIAGQAGADLAAPVVIDKMREPAKKIVGWFAQKFGGVADDTLKMLESRAPEVVQYARQGYEKATKAATNAGKEIQGHIEDYANQAGEEYRKAVEAIVKANPQYNNLRIDLNRMIGGSVDRIRNDFGFADQSARLPNLQLVDSSGKTVQAAQGAVTRVGKSEGDTALFNEFAAQAKNQMTPTQAYYLQRDLSDAIRSNIGKPIAAALAQLKKEVVGAFDSSVANTPIATTNKNYRIAMTLGEDLAKVGNADNPLQVVKSAFSRDTNTADALSEFFAKSPAAKAAWDKAQVADAGAKISAWSRHVAPGTGASLLPHAAIAEIAHVGGASIPGALATGTATFAATSPRLYGEAFNGLSKDIPGSVARGGATAGIAALRAMRKK